MVPTKLYDVPAQPSDLRHNTALDGLRGLAILLVLFCHLVYINDTIHTPFYALVRGIRGLSFCGVDIFFALSGFLITRILVKTALDRHFFLNFYARRSLRIFPLYYGVLFVLFALTPVLHIHWNGDQWRLLTYSNRLFPSSSGAAWNFYYGGFISLVNFWSLHIEEQFYMLWPVFVFFLRSPRRLLPVAGCISLACLVTRLILFHHGYSREFLYTSLITRADSLLIGACLALALLTRLHPRVLKLATPVFVSSLFLVLVDFQLQRTYLSSKNIFFPVLFTLLAICATALIAMCLKPASKTASVFRSPPLVFFGRYSYGLYVFHSVLPMFYMRWLLPLTASLRSPALAHLVNSAVELAVALAVSMLSYHFFEKPLLQLKRFFPSKPPAPEMSATKSSPEPPLSVLG